MPAHIAVSFNPLSSGNSRYNEPSGKIRENKEKTRENNTDKMSYQKETIFALSSGAGVAGIAVIRLSGPDTLEALRHLTGRKEFRPRYAHYCTLKDWETGETLDQALVLFFPAPHSFTGEDVAELHIHGGRAVLQSVLKALSRLPGCRPALAGEYSKRAVINGKMDLTQAEGLIDLIHAQTEKQQRQAFRQMRGALQQLYDSWREKLVHDLALMEAYIDFPEEEIPDSVLSQVKENVTHLLSEIQVHLADEGRGERLREGFRIALVGQPNIGKSSLLNRLTGREAAIVSSTAGTTRDVIETYLDIKGYPVILADTAGLHETDEEVEKEGILRAQKQIREADLVLLLQDARNYPEIDPTLKQYKTEKTLVVWNKKDLAASLPLSVSQTAVLKKNKEEEKLSFVASSEEKVTFDNTLDFENTIKESDIISQKKSSRKEERTKFSSEISKNASGQARLTFSNRMINETEPSVVEKIVSEKKLSLLPGSDNLPSFPEGKDEEQSSNFSPLADTVKGTAASFELDNPIFISAKTGEGCDILWQKLETLLEEKMGLTESPAVTRLRYRLQLEECSQSLQSFLNGTVLELQAEDLRLAARALGKITGRVEVEELFDIIFKDFCIGK